MKNSKIRRLLLKFHAWYYRCTGIYTKYARKIEQEFVTKEIGDEQGLGRDLLIGTWQVKHGFYRSSKYLKKRMKKKLKGPSKLPLKSRFDIFLADFKARFNK